MLTNPPLDLLLHPVALAVLGLVIGSFLNVVVHRLPLMMERDWWRDVAGQLADADSWRRTFGAKGEPPAAHALAASGLDKGLDALPALGIAKPRSRCPSCGRAIAWHENLPLVGWLRLKGRCSGCGARISARYPFVELLTAVLFAALAWRWGAQPVVLAWCAAAALLVVLAGIDWDTTLLPDSLTMPLLWGGLVVAALGWTIPLTTALWGAVAGYLSLWSVYWLFKLTTGKEGMGYGDFKLLAALGAWLGWQSIIPILVIASVIGIVVGLAMKARGALREGRYVPFGPFLAGAGLLMMVAGPSVLELVGWS